MHHNNKYFLNYFFTITNTNTFSNNTFTTNTHRTSTITYYSYYDSIYNGNSTEDHAS